MRFTQQKKRNNGNIKKNSTRNQCTINQFINNNTLRLISSPKMKTEKERSQSSQNIKLSIQHTKTIKEGCSEGNNLHLIPCRGIKTKETHKNFSETKNMAKFCQNLNCQNPHNNNNENSSETINSQCKFTAIKGYTGLTPPHAKKSTVQDPLEVNSTRDVQWRNGPTSMQLPIHKDHTEDKNFSITHQRGIGCQNLNLILTKQNNRDNYVKQKKNKCVR